MDASAHWQWWARCEQLQRCVRMHDTKCIPWPYVLDFATSWCIDIKYLSLLINICVYPKQLRMSARLAEEKNCEIREEQAHNVLQQEQVQWLLNLNKRHAGLVSIWHVRVCVCACACVCTCVCAHIHPCVCIQTKLHQEKEQHKEQLMWNQYLSKISDPKDDNEKPRSCLLAHTPHAPHRSLSVVLPASSLFCQCMCV